jgi:hypothetical protein
MNGVPSDGSIHSQHSQHSQSDRVLSPGTTTRSPVSTYPAIGGTPPGRYRQPQLSREELTDRAFGAENVQRHMAPVPRQNSEFSFALGSTDSPDAPGQGPFIVQPSQSRLVAAVRQLEASRTLANPADECSLCADPPWRIKDHDRVCPLKPKVECALVVAVGDPLVAGEEVALLLAPLILRWLHPARFPEVDVEMDDGKARLGRQRSRERALARSGYASDHDASADRDPWWGIPHRSRLGKALIRHQCILPDTDRGDPDLQRSGPFDDLERVSPRCRSAALHNRPPPGGR